MNPNPQRPKRRDATLSSLNAAIDAMNIAKDVMGMTPAKAAFASVSVILTMIRDSMINKGDYVELGLACAGVCQALHRGMEGRRVDELNGSVREAIEQLTRTVQQVEVGVAERGKRNRVSRLFHARNDKETITSWRSDLTRILGVFNAELGIITHTSISAVRRDIMDTHTVVSDIHGDVVSTRTVISGMQDDVANTHTLVSNIHHIMLQNQGEPDSQHHLIQASIPPGESPPPPLPCFGRGQLVEKIVGLAKTFTPFALIGAGGIGKTSIALALLHDIRIEKQFGENRRFIRCDKFPSTLVHFLRQLSNTIGAGIENPEDLLPLRPFLSSREMLIVLDNAESILDPKGTNGQEIYPVVEELSRYKTVCLCITSRITTVPQLCKRPIIPTLSMVAACDIFYNIYDNGDQSDVIENLLERLDFHALSITLLATTASHNVWDHGRLAKEWDMRRTQVLQTDFNESLAATIQLSLTSPTFLQLGPNAHALLGVIAFFPHGVDENNLEWLFPTISNNQTIIDKFCVLSLTHRSNNFITMLAPLRDYLCPNDPELSPLLCATKECYFSRLSVEVDPSEPGFEEAKWIVSEDVNVEHLLDVFTSIDAKSNDVWKACKSFMQHLYWHKPRLVILGLKLKSLPDNRASKPICLRWLSLLSRRVGHYAEQKQLLIHTLELWRKQGNKFGVATTLEDLAEVNQDLGLTTEATLQVKESLGIFEHLNHTEGQADCWYRLAELLHLDEQFDAAEEAASKSINLLLGKGQELGVCHGYHLLGRIYYSKRETDKATNHFETALGIASPNWDFQRFWILFDLARLSFDQGRFDDAHAHIEHAKVHTTNDPYHLGRAMLQQAIFWHKESRLVEAESEVLSAADIFEKLGAVKEVEASRELLQELEKTENTGYIQ